ncbi:MAG: JAB domain-containing protein [Ignavibacteriales bacterium]|nr:JAB domain-containing protein [Ignavibacteriales bacterium]
MADMKVRFKTLVWTFKDTSIKYPEYSELPRKKITSPQDFYNLFNPLLKEESKEVFLVSWLSSANRVQGFEIISSGSLTASVVDPRAVFRSAIVANCANIIIAHNHPSGNTEPSNEDISITKKLVEVGKIIEINIFDHIIFAEDKYTSFVERRLL